MSTWPQPAPPSSLHTNALVVPGDKNEFEFAVALSKGAKPGDLPAEIQQERWELVINLKSATQLGITIPDSVLAQAAEIIR